MRTYVPMGRAMFTARTRSAFGALRHFDDRLHAYPVAVTLAIQAAIGVEFWLTDTRQWDAGSALGTAGSVVLVLFMSYVIASHAVAGRVAIARLCGFVVYVVLAVLQVFAIAYYGIGTRSNWNMRLSHLDAVLVSVGTLTTAGTGGITPKSELARGLLVSQMVADFVVVTLLIGLILGVVIQRLNRNLGTESVPKPL